MQPIVRRPHTLGWVLAAGVFSLLVTLPPAVSSAAEITPEIKNRSDALDVPYVPSHDNVLRAMFEMAKPTQDDFLIDLGSGDGRIVITAARRFGTRGFGVDLNEGLVHVARGRAERAGVATLAKFEVRDLFKTDIRPATILTMYLLPEVVQELRGRLLAELQPGTRVVSHDYHLGDWRPDASRVIEIGDRPGRSEESIVYFWVVPARVAGSWQWSTSYPAYHDGPIGYSATIRQNFQDFAGSVAVFPDERPIRDGVLSGRRIAFAADIELDERIVRHEFTGIVDGDRIDGTVRLSGGVRPVTLPWRARRGPPDR